MVRIFFLIRSGPCIVEDLGQEVAWGSVYRQSILEILNDEIEHSTALYDYKARPAESMNAWFRGKADANFRVVGVESEAGDLLAFGSYGTFRAWPAR